MSSDHVLCHRASGFGISPYMQETMCFLGQLTTFEEATMVLETFRGIEVNAKQIERLCHCYGGEVEASQQELLSNGERHGFGQQHKEQPHYVMVDGAMYLTREDGWKEAKLARVFEASDNVSLSEKRKCIRESTYVAHLGNHKDFFDKLEYYMDELPRKIFIADGARWIWNYVADYYPEATQILDFYHAKEHLCEFANKYYKQEYQRHEWIEKQCTRILNDQVDKVIEAIAGLPVEGKMSLEKQKERLVNYYTENSHRMQYKTFREKGLLIGSGAIEAAHRNVLQQRMKRSGQRWTKQGFQQVANLRAIYQSNQQHTIKQLINKAA